MFCPGLNPILSQQWLPWPSQHNLSRSVDAHIHMHTASLVAPHSVTGFRACRCKGRTIPPIAQEEVQPKQAELECNLAAVAPAPLPHKPQRCL